MEKSKVSIGLPFYGEFSGQWVTHTLQFVASLKENISLQEIISSGVMTADHNRNVIAHEFLKSKADWLFWIDSDTIVPAGALERMLAHGKSMVSGLYYGKNPPHMPIAYTVYNGAYTPIDKTMKWDKGEIINVDAVGMGCMLTHRSVFEDILANYEVFQIPGGGLVPVHKNDLLGSVKDDDRHEHDNRVYKGQLRVRLVHPTLEALKFPFFMIDHLRTEDMFFMDLAKRVGHTPVLDTSVECGHLRWDAFTGAMYRDKYGR